MNSPTTTGPATTATEAVLGGALLFALAGCGGSGGGGGGGGGEPTTETNTDPRVDGPAITFESVTVTATSDDAAGAEVAGQSGARTYTYGSGGVPSDPGVNGESVRIDLTVDDADEVRPLAVVINATREDLLAGIQGFALKKHLLMRTGYGLRFADIERFADTPYDTVVDTLVDEMRQEPVQEAPSFAGTQVKTVGEIQDLGTAEREAYLEWQRQSKEELREWWSREMYATPSPLTERMVLFWHGIWTSSLDGLRVAHPMWRQNQTMRRHGTTNFATMAHLVAKDSAMAHFLDSNSNVKDAPNENFARELMELFMLGEGEDYTEQDIAEIARAFTGYHNDKRIEFEYRPDLHDYGSKTYFGTTHSFAPSDESSDGFSYLEGDYVIDQILAKDRCAIFVCEKLWDEFLSIPRNDSVIANWAATFRGSGYDVPTVLKKIFKSSQFKNAIGERVKPPVEFIIGTFRTLEIPAPNWGNLNVIYSQLHHKPFVPPGVQGWPTGVEWLDAEGYLLRRFHADRLYHQTHNELDRRHQTGLQELMLARPALGTIRTGDPDDTLRDCLTDPAYQLS